jgi:uncharacterized protein
MSLWAHEWSETVHWLSVKLHAMAFMNWVRAKVSQLLSIKDTPHALALGVAVGIYFGFVPLIGLKTLLALGITRVLRGNLVAAVIAVTLHDVLLPVAPFFMRWEYEIGYWLFSNPHMFPPTFDIGQQNPADWLRWSTFLSIGRPMLVGSLVFAAPPAVVSYYITLAWVGRSHRAIVAREQPDSSEES